MILKDLMGLWQKRVPGQLVIQFTDRCNATCPQCGMRVTEKFSRSKLPVDEVRRILDTAGERGIKAVSFTGGEPLLYIDEIATLIKHAGEAGIEFIRTGTNGFSFCGSESAFFYDRVRRIAEKLADTPLRNLWISIDSAHPDVHEKMQGLPGVLKGIEKGLQIFHQAGIYPSANLGVNRNVGGNATRRIHLDPAGSDNNRKTEFHHVYWSAFDRFYRFVAQLGFTMVNACYPMSVAERQNGDGMSAVYAATSESDVVHFNGAEKALLYKALSDCILKHRSEIRIFTPRSALHALTMQHLGGGLSPYSCRGGVDFFFIGGRDGLTYPCGYRGNEALGRFWEIERPHGAAGGGCTRCDWECFRDPSELFGPVLQCLSDPLELIKRIKKDPVYFRLWLGDLSYYRACELFNGRKPADARRLACFISRNGHTGKI